MGFELRNHKSLPQNTVKMFIGLNQTRFHLKFQACTGFDLIHIHLFLRSSHIWFSHIYSHIYSHSSIHESIWNQHDSQLPVGLLAQLVEHCIGIAEVMNSSPVQAQSRSLPYCFLRSSHIWFSYIYSHLCQSVNKLRAYIGINVRSFVMAAFQLTSVFKQCQYWVKLVYNKEKKQQEKRYILLTIIFLKSWDGSQPFAALLLQWVIYHILFYTVSVSPNLLIPKSNWHLHYFSVQ